MALDHREILVLGGRRVLGGGELHDLAFGDHRGGLRQDVERVERADLDHHPEGLAEQEVADQHARLVAPDHAGGELAAAELALVDDVVMEQRRGVHELDARRELDVAFAAIAAHFRRRERQHRPEPLAAGSDQMAGDLGDHPTSEPARCRMSSLTRSMARRVSLTSGWMLAPAFRLLSSSGTTTPKKPAPLAILPAERP